MQKGSGWLFPRYAQDNDIRATHASNTINKYLRETLGIPKTSHSFRHSMKIYFGTLDAPMDIQKALLGHGFPLSRRCLTRRAIPSQFSRRCSPKGASPLSLPPKNGLPPSADNLSPSFSSSFSEPDPLTPGQALKAFQEPIQAHSLRGKTVLFHR